MSDKSGAKSNDIRDKIALVLRIIAFVLYAFAVILFIVGFINSFGDINDFGGDDFELDDFNENIVGFGSIINKIVSYIATAFTCSVCGSILLIISNSLKFKVKKDMIESKKNNNNEEDLLNDSKIDDEKSKKYRVICAYCGSELDIDDKKCPNCGASKKIQKKIK